MKDHLDMADTVYRLYPFVDDPRYEGFGVRDMPSSTLGRSPTRDWQPKRLAATWTAPKAGGRVREFNDYPCVNLGDPAFSERAMYALRDMLEPNGELLPLTTKTNHRYFYYNVLTVADAIDIERSEIEWMTSKLVGITALNIRRFEFRADRLAGLSIFRIVEQTTGTFVTQPFVDRVKQHRLRGFNFIKVWPLPPGAIWDPWERVKMIARGELPPEPTLKDQSVILCLRLAKQDKGTSAERKRVKALMDEADALLTGADPDEPDIGSLEGHEYSSGEARLFFTCPDADALAAKLLPWLKRLEWIRGLYAAKRYGAFTDATADEAIFFKR